MDSATWARTDLLLTLGELSVISEMWEIERLVEGAPGTNFVEIKSVYDQTLHRAEQWSSWLVLLPSPPMIDRKTDVLGSHMWELQGWIWEIDWDIWFQEFRIAAI